MDTTTITVTKITTADIPRLRPLCEQTFSDTYAWGNSEENMQNYITTHFSENQLAKEIKDPNAAFYFANLNDQPVGYLKINFGPAQTELQDNYSLEIERIYVLQEFKGKKIGQTLLEKALQIARERQLKYLWLGVWAKNTDAIKFYEKQGFVPFGTHIFKFGTEEQLDLVLKLPIAP